MTQIVDRIISTYAQLNRETVHSSLLADLYADDIVFCDPLHRIEGIEALQQYFGGLYKNVEHIQFDFTDTTANNGSGYLEWVMTFKHPKINGGKAIKVPGVTRIKYDDKVTFHQDYFDSTHMIFDHIPVVGNIIKYLKNRLNR